MELLVKITSTLFFIWFFRAIYVVSRRTYKSYRERRKKGALFKEEARFKKQGYKPFTFKNPHKIIWARSYKEAQVSRQKSLKN